MTDDETTLQEKRAELKRVINEGMEKTFPAYFFNAIGRGLAKIFRLKVAPHWSVNAMVLLVLLLLPGTVVALRTGSITQWDRAHLFYFALMPFAYLSSIVSHINLTYNLFPGIRDHVVDSILSIEDLDNLKKWLMELFSSRKWLIFNVCAGFLLAIIFTIGLRFGIGDSIIGLALSTFFVAPFLIAPLYIILHMLTLPPRLAEYYLDLHESDPGNSEIIQHLIYILNVYLYLVAGYVATGTLLASLSPATVWWAWASILIAWIPTILQFLINQYAIRKIIITAKWKILNRLQAQIKELQRNKLSDAPDITITRLNQLMDLHDRISAKPNSILNWGTGLSFLNQLMLPLIGLLLGNIDKLLKLLARTP